MNGSRGPVGLDPTDAYSWNEREAWSVVLDENELDMYFGDDEVTFAQRLGLLPLNVCEGLQVAIDVVGGEPNNGANETRAAIIHTAAQVIDEMRVQELATMPYREYLRTPEWAARRERAIERSLGSCQLCNADGELEVHHRTYERRGRERDEDLVALCSRCHGLFHEWVLS